MLEHTTLFAYGIFKVIYAPREAFKEIIQNPRYLGPILIMVLFIAANVGSFYVLITKTYIEATAPPLEKRDLWTESKTFWQPLNGAECNENSTDYIAGNYYGNRSIMFWVSQSNKIAMQLQNISVNCSQGGYSKLYLRVKWTSPKEKPINAFLRVFSGSESSYLNITSEFSNAAPNVWNNLTIPLRKGWDGEVNWGNITGLMLEMAWDQPSDIKVLVDGLFFGGVYKPYAEGAATVLALYAANSFMQFTLRWFFLGGMIYVLIRLFRAKAVWRVVLILAGFALITMFIQALINTVAFSALPKLEYSLGYMGGVKGEAETAYDKILEETWLINRIYSVAQIITLVWTVVLCAIAVRLATELPWTTSILTTLIAYIVAIFLENFLIQI
jgi:hypothetical protein